MYHKQLRASLGRSRLRVVSVTCTEVLTFCLNVIHFLGLLHETKGKQNKKSNKKTYKIHVEMKRKNRSLLKSGVWWDNRYVISVRLYIYFFNTFNCRVIVKFVAQQMTIVSAWKYKARGLKYLQGHWSFKIALVSLFLKKWLLYSQWYVHLWQGW